MKLLLFFCFVFVMSGCATTLVQVKNPTCKPVPYIDESICELVKEL